VKDNCESIIACHNNFEIKIRVKTYLFLYKGTSRYYEI